jgi:hypothetical protein
MNRATDDIELRRRLEDRIELGPDVDLVSRIERSVPDRHDE